MVDFALNLGFNDYYGAYSGQYLNWQTKLKLGLRKHQLESTFRRHYYQLLKAITTQNYEQLEMLTEETLTKTIAAQMYELNVLHGYTFDCNTDLMKILDHNPKNKSNEEQQSSKTFIKDDISIVNHIFVRNCDVSR